MMSTNYAIYTKNEKEIYIKDINKIRLENKNKWIFINCEFDNKPIKIKMFNTWLQIYNINNVNYSNCMDVNVKQFKLDLLKGL